MNEPGNERNIRAETVPVLQSIIVDRDGNPWGPFAGPMAAANWAKTKWPDQEQDEDERTIGVPAKGWDVWALRTPD